MRIVIFIFSICAYLNISYFYFLTQYFSYMLHTNVFNFSSLRPKQILLGNMHYYSKHKFHISSKMHFQNANCTWREVLAAAVKQDHYFMQDCNKRLASHIASGENLQLHCTNAWIVSHELYVNECSHLLVSWEFSLATALDQRTALL